MFGPNKLFITFILSLFLGTLFCQKETRAHFSDYFIDMVLEDVIEFKMGEINKVVTPEQSRIVKNIEVIIIDDESYVLADARGQKDKPIIRINKRRLSELLKFCDILPMHSTNSFDTEIIEYYIKYSEHITYNVKDSLVGPEYYFALEKNEIQTFNSEGLVKLREQYYRELIFFLLSHEVAHHLFPDHLMSALSWKSEIEADNFAFSLILNDHNPLIYYTPFFIYIMTLDQRGGSQGQPSNSHPATELRAIELVHKEFDNFQLTDSLFSKYGDSDFDKRTYYKQLGKSILQMLDDYMLGNNLSYSESKSKAENEELFYKMLLGYRYWIGYGKWEQNLEKADHWLRKAVETGNKDAFLIYAMFLEFEHGAIQDAHKMYHKALDAGNRVAELHLAQIHQLEEKNKINMLEGNAKIYSRKIQACMKRCMDHYQFTKKECELDMCKKRLHSMNSWLISIRKSILSK